MKLQFWQKALPVKMWLIEPVRVFRTLAMTAVSMLVTGIGSPKVFAIGLNKTATTSLHHIFVELGYRSYHGTAWRDTSRWLIFQHYDAFSDGPPEDFIRLDRRFPGSKFILQVRNLDDWIDSRLEHIRRLPHRRGRGKDWAISEDAIRAWVARRDRHHAGVLRYFQHRQGDLLVLNYIRDPQSAARVCAFLGKPVCAQKPHSNPDPAAKPPGGTALKNPEMIARALTSLGIPEAAWKNDLQSTDPALPGDTGNLGPAGSSLADASRIA